MPLGGRDRRLTVGILIVLALVLSTAARSTDYQLRAPVGLDAVIPVPAENPVTVEKAALGGQLFFDKRLSRDRTVACASCHRPERAFTDGRRVAIGIHDHRGSRNTPTIFNRAYASSVFWDGRATALEEQPLEAIHNPREMDLGAEELERRLGQVEKYREQFAVVFGEAPSAQTAAKAIATFVRTLLSGNSAFDQFEHGDSSALTVPARRGLELFRNKGRCVTCHREPLFSDHQFNNTGVSWLAARSPASGVRAGLDRGRYEVSGLAHDTGAFKTPSLRDIARTAPYMHSGILDTLEAVIEFYDRGGQPNPYLDASIEPLTLTSREKADLVAFLRSLTGTH